MIDIGAIVSDCGLYRYRLWRIWDAAKPPLPICMLNPSTADASKDDPTIRRCIGFATREGFGGIIVVNLFAFRATKPEALKDAADPIGPENLAHLQLLATSAAAGATPLLCAWGAGRDASHAKAALAAAHLVCLGRTADGSPRHPLYVKANSPMERFTI